MKAIPRARLSWTSPLAISGKETGPDYGHLLVSFLEEEWVVMLMDDFRGFSFPMILYQKQRFLQGTLDDAEPWERPSDFQ